MSPRARLLATVALVLTFLVLEAMVIVYRGANPASVTGVAIGTVLGLGCLVLELNVIGRAMRSLKGDVAGATFQTFAMRLALVAPLTFVFQRSGSSVDGTAFAVGYLVTFFVYLCWLTWTTYHAPVQYKARPKQFTPRVVDRRRVAEASGSER